MPYSEVMSKFRRGALHSGSKTGPKALAIMLSEKRQKSSLYRELDKKT